MYFRTSLFDDRFAAMGQLSVARPLAIAIELSGRAGIRQACAYLKDTITSQAIRNGKVFVFWKCLFSMLSNSSLSIILIFWLTSPLFSPTSTCQDQSVPSKKHALVIAVQSLSQRLMKNWGENFSAIIDRTLTNDIEQLSMSNNRKVGSEQTRMLKRSATARLQITTLETAPIVQQNYSSNTSSLTTMANTHGVFGEK